MPNWNELEQTLTRHLNLDRAPVAITFCDAAPAGVRKFDGSVPSGCTFWKVAATAPAGQGAFYTVAADHQNCPIGAHTHNVPQVDGGRMLNEMLGMMAGLGYVKMEEVPQIPRWPRTPAAVVYARLGEAPLAPDVVIVACRASAVMYLGEAARSVGAASAMPPLLRPTCMAIPAAAAHGARCRSAASAIASTRDPGRSRLHDGARRRPGERRGRSRWHHERQRATHDVSPDPSPDAHQRRSGTSVIIHGSLPSEDTALVLLFTLIASGKIELRRIDG